MINRRSASELRRKAEDKVALQQQPVGELDAMRLLHELQVYQVELEMQNEELRRANEELRSAKEQLLHLASFPQLNPNPVLEVDATGKVTYSNPATQSILKMLGIAEDDASAFVPPDLKDIFREWDRKNIFSLHRELLINDRYFLDVISFSPQSDFVRIYVQDITEQKRAEYVLQEAHGKLEMLVSERTRELAATVDTLQSEIAESERMAAALLRNNRLYAVLGATNLAIVHASDRDNLFREFCRIAVEQGGFLLSWVGLLNEENSLVRIVASCGAVGYLEGISISTKEGPFGAGPTGIAIRKGTHYICNDFQNAPNTQPWHEKGLQCGVNASASVALKEDGRVIGAFTIYADEKDFFDLEQEELIVQMGENVSFALENMLMEANRKKAELSLYEETLERLRAVEALREKDQMLVRQNSLAAMGEMISNIAHQWRQPLNVISLIIQSVQLRYESGKLTSEEMNSDIQDVMENIMHMSQTIEDFRNFFKQDKVKQEFFISEAVKRALSLVSASLENHNIKVEIKTEDDATVIGYQNEYSQVLLNIISNTCDACSEHKVPNPRIVICIALENERSVLYIRDNCGGIPDDMISKIFDPYFTTRGPDKGTGIGLYMSRMIIEQNMNGHLTVCNTDGGAEFRIEV